MFGYQGNLFGYQGKKLFGYRGIRMFGYRGNLFGYQGKLNTLNLPR